MEQAEPGSSNCCMTVSYGPADRTSGITLHQTSSPTLDKVHCSHYIKYLQVVIAGQLMLWNISLNIVSKIIAGSGQSKLFSLNQIFASHHIGTSSSGRYFYVIAALYCFF
jgi:hypothetical protein